MLKRNTPKLLTILVGVLLAFYLMAIFLYNNKDVSSDLFSGAALLFTGLIAVGVYLYTRDNDRLILSEKKRDDFINTVTFNRIRTLVEHNDVELQVMVAVLNVSNPYEPDLIPSEYQKLHDELDQYLNFLEGVAILSEHNNISKESLESLWLYYFRRLRDIQTPLDDVGVNWDKLKKSISSKYSDKTPASVNEVLNRLAHVRDYQTIPDPVDTTKQIDPIKTPIWYYINQETNVFTAITRMVRRNYAEGVGENEAQATALSSLSKIALWVRDAARLFLWFSALLFGVLTVLGVLPILPANTAMVLLIWLYMFMFASLLEFVIESNNIYERRKRTRSDDVVEHN